MECWSIGENRHSMSPSIQGCNLQSVEPLGVVVEDLGEPFVAAKGKRAAVGSLGRLASGGFDLDNADIFDRGGRKIGDHLERNDMFMEVAKEFLALIGGEHRDPTCMLEDGMRVLTVIEAIRRSRAAGSTVTVAS